MKRRSEFWGKNQPNESEFREEVLVNGQRLNMLAIAGAKILLVEDNELNQLVAIELLNEGGFVVDVAENGEIAIEMVKKNEYDLVLMDMQMPVLDGLEATRRIRSDERFAELAIIAMTANVMAGDRERCITAGMNDHLAKPIEPDHLFEMLKLWIPPKNNIEDSVPSIATNDNDFFPEPELKISVSGLDVELGLKRVLGKKKSYLNILKKFISGQKSTIEELNQAISDSDYNSAERLVHTLKGVAGNIGAMEIRNSAIILETALHEHPSKDTLNPLIINLNSQLKKMIESLEVYFLTDNHVTKNNNSVATKDDQVCFLNELLQGIQTRKPKKCTEVLESYQTFTWPNETKADIVEMSRLVSKYRYREAAEQANSLLIKLSEV